MIFGGVNTRFYIMSNIFNRYFKVLSFIVFVTFTYILRSPSFFSFNLDDDEGIYLLMGRFLTEGHLPYIHYWDHQPPLIYLLSWFVQLIGIKSIIGIRVVSAVFVCLTGYVLNLISLFLFNRKWISFFCGAFYIFAVSSYHVGGLAFNNELIFNFFTVLSLFYLLQAFNNDSKIKRIIFLAGLLCGFGFLTKQQVIYDFVSFIFLFFLFSYFQKGAKKYKYYIPVYIVASLIPISIIGLIYLVSGHINEYFFAIWESNIRYVTVGSVNKMDLIYFKINVKHFLFLVPVILSTLFIKKNKLKSYIYSSWFKAFLMIWLLINLYGVSLSKTYYLHYFIQVLLPITLILGYSFTCVLNKQHSSKYLIITFFIVCIGFFSSKHFDLNPSQNHYKKSAIFKAAEFLVQNKDTFDTMFVVDGDVILYYLADFDIITRYAFPIHLTNPKYAHAFNFDQEKEFLRVFNLNPTWLIMEDSLRSSYRDIKQVKLNNILHDNLEKYNLEQTFTDLDENIINVFHRK